MSHRQRNTMRKTLLLAMLTLLTLTTADGKQHTVRLLKQSDIFDE